MEWFFKEELKDFKPYEPADSAGFLKLNANECPYDLSAKTKKKIAKAVIHEDFTRYSDPTARALRKALSDYAGIDPEYIVAGNGSSEIIQLIMNAFLHPGETVVAIDPTFTMYIVIAKAAGVRSVEVPVGEGFQVDADAMIEAANKEKAKLVFLCTPNNPTGTPMARADIEKIIDNTEALIVIDEAYGEFGEENFIDLVIKNPRVIVLRTLSKAFGLAGLRTGYGIADPFVIKELNKVRLPYNLNTLSQVAVEIALQDQAYLQEKISLIKSERERMFSAMQAMSGVTVFPSAANFLLFRTKLTGECLNAKLRSKMILIRDFSAHPLLIGCMRVTVGRPEENDVFLNALKEIVSEG